MRPRTKRQKAVAAMAAEMPELTDEQRAWAEKRCFKATGYLMRKGTVWCHECGTEFAADISPLAADLEISEAVCPVCGKKLKVVQSRCHSMREDVYFTVLQTCKGMQVCRHYEIVKESFRGRPGARYNICEVVQNWIDEHGHETIMAKRIGTYGYRSEWVWESDMEVRAKTSYYWNENAYKINAYFTYPERKILPILRRNGYTARFGGIAPSELFKMLLTDSEAERLMKARRYDLLSYRYMHGKMSAEMDSIMHVAIKHGYFPKDVQTWADYVCISKQLGKDMHNPALLCVKDVKEAHDKAQKLLERKRQKAAREKAIAEAARHEADYARNKGKFFGLCFGNDDLKVSVISSVAEMAKEGNAMHHCVYEAAYYAKPESLILTARDNDGKRVETVEVSLKTFDVVQSRGVCNKNTPYHDEIVALVRSNINLIRRRAV